MKLHNKTLLTALTATAALAAGSAGAATINVGDSLIPAGLNVGDSFHLVFVTGMDGEVSDDNDLNSLSAFVTQEANEAGSVVASLGLSWSVIGSGVEDQAAYDLDPVGVGLADARDHALVSAPVYRVDGVRVATGFADLWDGTIENTITVSEDGTTTISGVVYTSTLADGTVNGSTRTLGVTTVDDGRMNRGQSQFTDSQWVDAGNENGRDSRNLYALSEAITIVPEPGSLALLAMGGLLIGARRRRG